MIVSQQEATHDPCLEQVRQYIQQRRFDQSYVLTCVADIARHTGYNPRTIEIRIKQLIESQEITQIDSYPRKGRATVHVFRINETLSTQCLTPTSLD